MGYPFTYVNNSSQLTSDNVVCSDSCRIYPSRDSISTYITGQDYNCKTKYSDFIGIIALEDYMLDIDKIKQILKKIEKIKTDIKSNDSTTTYVQYQLFDPISLIEVDLNYCKVQKIKNVHSENFYRRMYDR